MTEERSPSRRSMLALIVGAAAVVGWFVYQYNSTIRHSSLYYTNWEYDGSLPLFLDTVRGLPPEQRAQALIANMTLDEKIGMLHGYSSGCLYTGCAKGVARLGIPDLHLSDGPQGFRNPGDITHDYLDGTSTSFPSALAVAATMDTVCAEQWGQAMGQEFHDKGSTAQLGPGMCVARTPQNGRNFEYLSGEDPVLGQQMARAAIRGIQSKGVLANAKHFILNNQETERFDVAVRGVSKRTRMEIYYPPFVGAIEAQVASIMCSYNRLETEDGVTSYSCDHALTLQEELKDELGFAGFVMSDWGATHALSIRRGLDQEMPGQYYFGPTLKTAVETGSIPVTQLDQSLQRILVPMIAIGILDGPRNTNLPNTTVTSDAHRSIARAIAADSMVLIKNAPSGNRNVLPLDYKRKEGFSIGVFGAASASTQQYSGGGSGHVETYRESCAFNALWNAVVGERDTRPQSCASQSNVTYHGPGPVYGSRSAQDCCDYCKNRPGCNYWTFDDQRKECLLLASVKGTKKQLSDDHHVSGALYAGMDLPACAPVTDESGKRCVHLHDGSDDLVDAQELASHVDVAMVFVQTNSAEGFDRKTLSLGEDQEHLIQAVATAAKKTVVVVTAPGAALMPWSDQVDAILVAFMLGEQAGPAMTDVLLGKVAPSGRLPLTFPNVDNEMNLTPKQYPGVNRTVDYDEALLVGYRWYYAHNVTPKFPFGHGLSYTEFGFSDFHIITTFGAMNRPELLRSWSSSPVVVKGGVTITNVGEFVGRAVAMLYVTYPISAQEPPRQLKDIIKTQPIKVGQELSLSLDVTAHQISIYNSSVVPGQWQIPCGTFSVYIALSGATPATQILTFEPPPDACQQL